MTRPAAVAFPARQPVRRQTRAFALISASGQVTTGTGPEEQAP